jgi:hypothetical protein
LPIEPSPGIRYLRDPTVETAGASRGKDGTLRVLKATKTSAVAE